MPSGVFPPDVIAAAIAARSRGGIFPSVTLAQWALESAWGSRMSGKNNPFGIKATANQPGTVVLTHEQNAAGIAHAETDRFADYASMAEAFEAHRVFLSTPRYKPVHDARNAEDAARALQACGYATDVSYPSKLITIMRAHNLYPYDTPAPNAPTVAAAPPIIGPHIGMALPESPKGFWARFWAALKG